MSQKIVKVEEIINAMSESELRVLNHKIVNRLKLLNKARNLQHLSKFNVLFR